MNGDNHNNEEKEEEPKQRRSVARFALDEEEDDLGSDHRNEDVEEGQQQQQPQHLPSCSGRSNRRRSSLIRPSLHSLEASIRNLDHGNSSSNNNNNNNPNDDTCNSNANFKDYLKAQRSLRTHRRMSATGAAFAVAGSPRNNNNIHTAETAAAMSGGCIGEDTIIGGEQKDDGTAAAVAKSSSSDEGDSLAGLEEDDDDAQQWDKVFRELSAIDEDGHFDDPNHGMSWYNPPVQRQRWGQDQILPHVNWGDLFFDLFYVAAAYNLGTMLISGLNPSNWVRAVVYFVGIFGPLFTTWETAMYYSSRYTVVDYAHRLFEVMRFVAVAFAVLHVKGLDLMADEKSVETFSFTLAIWVESVMHLILNVELFFKGQGDRGAIQKHTLRKIKHQLVPTILVYTAAVAVSGVLYFRPATETTTVDDYNNGGYSGNSSSGNYTSAYEGGTGSYKGTRLLAGEGDYYGGSYEEEPQRRWEVSDLALTLTAFAYVLNITSTSIRKIRATNGKNGDIRQQYVPNNIDYVIHRYGEWVMLMIGESVLSLLIVETTESGDYYLVATFGALTVILLQILKFESEPSHAEGHALWRNMRNAMCYGYLIQILSMGLIAFGVSYKVFLNTVVKEEDKEEGYESHNSGGSSRMLAASAAVTDEASAALFTGSLSIVLLTLELILLTHDGVKKAFKQLFRETGDRDTRRLWATLHWPMVLISVFKAGLIAFTCTLNQWTTDSTVLTFCGFAIVAAMAITRVLGWAFEHHRDKIDQAAHNITKNIKKQVSFGPSTRDDPDVRGSSCRDANDDKDESEAGSVSTYIMTSIDESFDAIVVSDLKGVIKKVNTTALDMFGYASKEEIVGKNLTLLVGGGEAMNHDMYMKGFRERGRTSKVLGRQRMLHARRANGEEFPCVIGVKLCANDTRVVGFIRDMSGVVKDEKSKMSTTMRVSDLIDRIVDDHSFDAIVVSDANGIIRRVNKKAASEFGFDDKDDIVGQSISTLIDGDIHVDNPNLDEGHQRVVMLKRKGAGDDFQSILATKKIDGTNMVAYYIRNIDPIKSSFKCGKCD